MGPHINYLTPQWATAAVGGTAVAGSDGGAAVQQGFGYAYVAQRSVAFTGKSGTAVGWDDSTAIAGDGGTAAAGESGCIILKWYDGLRDRWAIGYVGEDGIEPNVPYRCDENGKFVKADG